MGTENSSEEVCFWAKQRPTHKVSFALIDIWIPCNVLTGKRHRSRLCLRKIIVATVQRTNLRN